MGIGRQPFQHDTLEFAQLYRIGQTGTNALNTILRQYIPCREKVGQTSTGRRR